MPYQIPPVHLKATGRRNATNWANPLGEAGQPGRSAGIDAIVRYLNVETSTRYVQRFDATYCNVYAHDVCYLAGVYLPRVWWMPKALAQIAAGQDVAVQYGVTVAEQNANALYAWLRKHGGEFGWYSVDSLEALQDAANQGKLGVICAQRKVLSAPGHISIVVAEQPPSLTAERVNDNVRLPLQSQAGARNFCFSRGTGEWWKGTQFQAHGFWVHD